MVETLLYPFLLEMWVLKICDFIRVVFYWGRFSINKVTTVLSQWLFHQDDNACEVFLQKVFHSLFFPFNSIRLLGREIQSLYALKKKCQDLSSETVSCNVINSPSSSKSKSATSSQPSPLPKGGSSRASSISSTRSMSLTGRAPAKVQKVTRLSSLFILNSICFYHIKCKFLMDGK